jgi:hypothetical protein
VNTLTHWAEAWFHLSVNPNAFWNGMPCSADGDPSHINPRINDTFQHDALQAGAGAAWAGVVMCAGTGVAWFGCVGTAFMDGAAASIVANNGSFTSACHQ